MTERATGPTVPAPGGGGALVRRVTGVPSGMAVGSSMTAGLVVVALFLGGFGVWAAVAPLDSGAVAPGVIGVSSERKTVGHLEGGIIKEIFVADGDIVAAGQTLIALDDTRARATLDLLEAQLRSALALNARLEAERDGLLAIRWPTALLTQAALLPQAAEVLTTQSRIFEARAVSLANQVAIYERRIEQSRARAAGLRDEMTSLDRQIELLDEALFDVRRTVLLGLESKHQRLMDLRRDRETTVGARARNASDIAGIELNITETELLIDELRNRQLEQVAAELREVETELSDLREQVATARDVVARTRIAAPAAGTVLGLRVFTPGGVIEPGEPLLQIVPTGDRLIIEARVAPNDRESVEVGLPAQVRLPAFSQFGAPRLAGEVIRVSADRFANEQMAWYRGAHRARPGAGRARGAAADARHAGRRADRDRKAHSARLPADAYLREPRTRPARRIRDTPPARPPAGASSQHQPTR